MTKGQVSAEFIGVMTIMFIILTVFSVVILVRTIELQDQKNWNRIIQLGEIIASEIRLADTMHDGFARQFWIPQSLDGFSYTTEVFAADDVNRNKTTIQIRYTGGLNNTVPYSLNLPKKVRGNVTTGFNNISKMDGVICINLASCP